MKVRELDYTFTPGGAGAGTVVFNGIAPDDLASILLINNATRGTVIFNPFNSATNGTFSGSTLTLTASTTGQNSGDKLLIYWEDNDTIHESKVGYSFTRPANTTAYTAKDVVSNATSSATIMSFTNLSRAKGKGGYIVRAKIETDQKTCVARFRLHLWDTSVTAKNDNDPFDFLNANASTRIGWIDFGACATEDATTSTGAVSVRDDLRLKYQTASGSRTIYGILETLDAFTPANGQSFRVDLWAENN